jgi:hypothetical protein
MSTNDYHPHNVMPGPFTAQGTRLEGAMEGVREFADLATLRRTLPTVVHSPESSHLTAEVRYPPREERTVIGSISPDRTAADLPSLLAFDRLRRTKTVEWMIAYIAMSALIFQLVDILCEVWNWPLLLQRALSLVLGLGSLPALVLTWYHGEQGRQDFSATELLLLAGLVVVTVATVWAVCFPA